MTTRESRERFYPESHHPRQDPSQRPPYWKRRHSSTMSRSLPRDDVVAPSRRTEKVLTLQSLCSCIVTSAERGYFAERNQNREGLPCAWGCRAPDSRRGLLTFSDLLQKTRSVCVCVGCFWAANEDTSRQDAAPSRRVVRLGTSDKLGSGLRPAAGACRGLVSAKPLCAPVPS